MQKVPKVLKINILKSFGSETRWNITFLRGFSAWNQQIFPPKWPKPVFYQDWCTRQELLEFFCPFIPYFAIGEWLFFEIPAGVVFFLSQNPAEGLEFPLEEPRWSLFFSHLVGIREFHRKSLAKISCWGKSGATQPSTGHSHSVWVQEWFYHGKEGKKSQNQADPGILEMFIQWEDFSGCLCKITISNLIFFTPLNLQEQTCLCSAVIPLQKISFSCNNCFYFCSLLDLFVLVFPAHSLDSSALPGVNLHLQGARVRPSPLHQALI